MGSVPPVAQSPARRVSTSPMLVTRPSPASFANGLPESVPPQVEPTLSGLPQGEGQTEEMLMQARLQQQHILQRQVLAAQQAQQVQGIARQGMGSPNQGNAQMGGGMPGNLNPAQQAYLRQQGMTPQQMVALNMFAAQQRAQQAAQQSTATSSPSLNQSPALAQQNQPMANRIPPHLMAQFAALQGFPSNAAGGATPGAGMSNEQTRAILQMQTALYQQRLQQSQQGAQSSGQNLNQQSGMGQNQQSGMGSGGQGSAMAQMMGLGGGMQGMGQR